MDLTPVQSSNIAAVGYDAIENVLHIQFKGKDTVYTYAGVPPETYQLMMTADSIGSFYARHIKSTYKGQAVSSKESKSKSHEIPDDLNDTIREYVDSKMEAGEQPNVYEFMEQNKITGLSTEAEYTIERLIRAEEGRWKVRTGETIDPGSI